MKKLIALLLVLATALSLCVGCAGNETPGQQAGSSDEQSGDRTTLTIGVSANANILDWEENALTRWLEEQCDVDLKFTIYATGADAATQISTTIAAMQELPDIMWGITLGEDVYTTYGEDGYFIDMAEYFEDKEGASKVFWDRIAENFDEYQQTNIVSKLRDPDTGAIYAVPTLETSLIDTMDYQMWINTEWLKKVGKEMPTNKEELYDVLVAFRDEDPNGNGKADEIPLFGAEGGSLGADVVNWLINMFLYLDDRKVWNVDEEGKLYAPFTTDEYREALIFVRKLVEEGLLNSMAWTAKSADLKGINTPIDGTPLCGIFAGHLTLHANMNSELLYQYEPLPCFGNAVVNDDTFNRNTHITEYCDNPDKAFEVMMTMWSEEGSRRIRYGEYGVNWTDADPGAVSELGIEADIKILQDPFAQQNTAMWGKVGCTLNVNAEGESNQTAVERSEWENHRSKLAAQQRKYYEEAMEKNNPEVLCPALAYNDDATYDMRQSLAEYWTRTRTDFCNIGTSMDPNNDADWAEYLKALDDMGLQQWQELAQMRYDQLLEYQG